MGEGIKPWPFDRNVVSRELGHGMLLQQLPMLLQQWDVGKREYTECPLIGADEDECAPDETRTVQIGWQAALLAVGENCTK